MAESVAQGLRKSITGAEQCKSLPLSLLCNHIHAREAQVWLLGSKAKTWVIPRLCSARAHSPSFMAKPRGIPRWGSLPYFWVSLIRKYRYSDFHLHEYQQMIDQWGWKEL